MLAYLAYYSCAGMAVQYIVLLFRYIVQKMVPSHTPLRRLSRRSDDDTGGASIYTVVYIVLIVAWVLIVVVVLYLAVCRYRRNRWLISQGMDAQDLALRRQVRLTGTVPKQNKRVLTEREVSELPTFALTPSDITETLKVAQAGSEGHVTLAIPEPALVKEKLPLHEENCAVCLEDFRAGEQVRRLACRHYFHLQCIDPWLTAQAATCPLCNYNVATDNMAA